MTATLDALVAFVGAHAAWAPPIVCLITFAKSLAFVALVVPGITLMLAIGGLVGAAGLDFVPIWLAASLGAALGDWVSYAIGCHLQGRAATLWPFSRHPELLPRGAQFCHRWGAMSIVLCRFVGPLRATVPLFCGICGMRSRAFHVANWPSALLWAALLLGPGHVAAGWLTRWLN